MGGLYLLAGAGQKDVYSDLCEHALIKDIMRDPFDGIGKPEPLKGDLSGLWSRRIDETNRIVYFEQNGMIYIVSCRGHY